jgi:hypothetical protein
MANLLKSTAIAVVVVAVLFVLYALVASPRIESQVTTPATKTPEANAARQREYREAVLKRIEMGDVVSVPDDRIGFLEGEVKLVQGRKDAVKRGMIAKSLDSKPKIAAGTQIEELAGRLERSDLRDGLKIFARNATDDQKFEFLNIGGKVLLDDFSAGAKAAPQPTEDPAKKCYESCETIFHIVCKEVCKWDCRIVNGEKVCEKSCETICPEIRNIVCKKICD